MNTKTFVMISILSAAVLTASGYLFGRAGQVKTYFPSEKTISHMTHVDQNGQLIVDPDEFFAFKNYQFGMVLLSQEKCSVSSTINAEVEWKRGALFNALHQIQEMCWAEFKDSPEENMALGYDPISFCYAAQDMETLGFCYNGAPKSDFSAVESLGRQASF